MNIKFASASDIRSLANMGLITREAAHAAALDRVTRYTEAGKSESKIARWVRLADAFANAEAPAQEAKPAPKPKVKAKAKPKAEAAPAPTFTRLTKASARDLIASRKILSRDEKAALADFITRLK